MYRVSKNSRHVLIACALAVLVIALTGCSASTTKTSDAAATVNSQKISTAALDAEISKLKLQNPNIFDAKNGGMDEATVRKTLLDELINQQLLLDEATKKGVKVTEAQITSQIASIKAGYNDQKQFEQAVKSAGYTMESLKEQTKWQLMSTALLEKMIPSNSITDKDAQNYYDANKASYKRTAAKRASHILFETSQESTAKKVLAEIKDGGDFSALAKKYSKDAGSAVNGGDLGWPTAAYVKEFQKALDGLDKGEMSGIVKTAYGWHIIKVTDVRKAGLAKFADVSEEVKQTLLNEKRTAAYETLLADLRKAAKIEILDKAVTAAAAKPAAQPATGGGTSGGAARAGSR